MVTIFELGASVTTIAILVFLVLYIAYRNGIKNITTIIFTELAAGSMITVSDYIIGYVYQNSPQLPLIDCVGFRLIVFGISITAAGLFHLISVFPRKMVLYNAVPSIYIFSYFIALLGLLTPLVVRCSPSGGVRNILWPAYLLWVAMIFLISAGALHYSFATSPTKLQRLQAGYMLVGIWIALIWAGIGQFLPTFVPGLHFITAVFSLPIAGIFVMIAIVKYKMLLVNVEKERKVEERKIEVKEGVINLVINEHTAFLAFRDLSSKYPGMIITIKPPNVIRDRYKIEKSPVIWLTYFPQGYEQGISPDKLFFEVMYSIINFVDRGGKVILLHGAEYLIETYGKKHFLEFVYEINRLEENLTLIVALNSDPEILEGVYDYMVVERLPILDQHVMSVSRNDMLGREEMIIITAKTKDQIHNIYGEKHSILEITHSFSPDRLVFEGMDKINRMSKRDVFFECFDYILASIEQKKVVQFLKDVIDVVVYSGNNVYVLKTPNINEYPAVKSLIESEIS